MFQPSVSFREKKNKKNATDKKQTIQKCITTSTKSIEQAPQLDI